MTSKVVYIDESGNEGDVAGHPAPFAQQPTFALAAIVEDEGSESVARLLCEVKSAHRLQAEDLKWKSLKNKPAAFAHLLEGLENAGIELFVELMDKRHFVANNIVTYVLFERRINFGNPQTRSMANSLADLIASEVGDESLVAYGDVAKTPTRESFVHFIKTLQGVIGERLANPASFKTAETLALLMFVCEVLDDVFNRWRTEGPNARVDRFVQEPDKSIGGHRIGLLPQVQAFGNLLARLNIHLAARGSVRLIHDEQKEFDHILREYFGLLASNNDGAALNDATVLSALPVSWDFPSGKFRLSFADSQTNAGVQVADIIAGFCRARLDAVSAGDAVDARFDRSARYLQSIGLRLPPAGVLFVTTQERLDRFLGASRL